MPFPSYHACSLRLDSLTIPNKYWKGFRTHEPAPLTQIYFQCTTFLPNVIFNAYGIALANAANLGFIACTTMICLAHFAATTWKSLGIELPTQDEARVYLDQNDDELIFWKKEN